MIKPFGYYVNEKQVRKSVPNPSMARSLLQKAEIRFKRIEREKINESESSLLFEDIYESLREAAQSLMEIKGYKPYSHEALISFLKEYKFLDDAKVNEFNNYRVLRNNSVYKAEHISLERCEEEREFAKRIIQEIRKKFVELVE